MDIEHILEHGAVFRKSSSGANNNQEGKVKTKAKKTSYIKGAHGSDSAKMKAEYRKKRANRHK